jgi:sulfur carrier protein
MNIKINGEPSDIAQDALSITELLTLKNVEQPDMVSVQLNGEFVDRPSYASTQLKERDEVDFLYFMGGGGW